MSVQDAMSHLQDLAAELDLLSRGLLAVDKQLEPVAEEYRRFVDDFEIGLYERSTDDDGYKLPSEAMRLKLAHRAMPPDLYGKWRALTVQRERGVQRIRDIKVEVEAQRSLLSAAKTEMDATR